MKIEQKEYLAEIYSRDTLTSSLVAEICDKVLDRTGTLLGEIRQICRQKYMNHLV